MVVPVYSAVTVKVKWKKDSLYVASIRHGRKLETQGSL